MLHGQFVKQTDTVGRGSVCLAERWRTKKGKNITDGCTRTNDLIKTFYNAAGNRQDSVGCAVEYTKMPFISCVNIEDGTK